MTRTPRCSFCHGDKRDGEFMFVAGERNAPAICQSCVSECVAIVSEARREGPKLVEQAA